MHTLSNINCNSVTTSRNAMTDVHTFEILDYVRSFENKFFEFIPQTKKPFISTVRVDLTDEYICVRGIGYVM